MVDFELMTYTYRIMMCRAKAIKNIMKHIHLPWAFFFKSGILRTSVYNVYGSQNEFVDSVTVSLEYSFCAWAEWPSTTGCRICGSENYGLD